MAAPLTATTRAEAGGETDQADTLFDFSSAFDEGQDGHGTHTAGTAHRTHTAGTAVGDTLECPDTTETCAPEQTLGCIGQCLSMNDDTSLLNDGFRTWDTLCPQFDCDNFEDPCLGEDVCATLTKARGVAPGAKISFFDVSVDGYNVSAYLAMNGLWESTNGTGSFLHSNSWGYDNDCCVDSLTLAYDKYMYEVRREVYLWRGTVGSLTEIEALSSNVGYWMA